VLRTKNRSVCGTQIMCKNQIKNINLLENVIDGANMVGYILHCMRGYNNSDLLYIYKTFYYFDDVKTCTHLILLFLCVDLVLRKY